MKVSSTLYPWTILTKLFGLNLYCELNIKINLEKIKEEYLKIIDYAKFKNHSGGAFDGGGWGAIGLITYGGDPFIDYVDKNKTCKPTYLLDKCNYIKELLNKIPGEKERVRFMEVKPKTIVHWHYDNNETVDHLNKEMNVRLHIPIITSKNVKLFFCHQTAEWEEGKLYYGDFSFPHSIKNTSDINRIHLVIDVKINDKLLKCFPNEFLKKKKQRLLIKKICQRSCNLFKKLYLVESNI